MTPIGTFYSRLLPLKRLEVRLACCWSWLGFSVLLKDPKAEQILINMDA